VSPSTEVLTHTHVPRVYIRGCQVICRNELPNEARQETARSSNCLLSLHSRGELDGVGASYISSNTWTKTFGQLSATASARSRAFAGNDDGIYKMMKHTVAMYSETLASDLSHHQLLSISMMSAIPKAKKHKTPNVNHLATQRNLWSPVTTIYRSLVC
jgi:hypothetical protein